MRHTLAILSLLILVGCAGGEAREAEPTDQDTNDDAPVSMADSSMNAAAMGYIEYQIQYHGRDALVSFADHWYVRHADEIAETLEIADTSVAGDIGLVFARYTVGSDVFRRAMWMERHGGLWYPNPGAYYFYSEYTNDDPFQDGQPERAQAMIEAKDAWEENSAEMR